MRALIGLIAWGVLIACWLAGAFVTIIFLRIITLT